MKNRISPHRIFVILFWIALWQLAAMVIQNDIIFAGPADVVRSLSLLLPSAEFWISIGHSFGKITLGFAAAFAAGIFFGSLAFRFRLLQELLEPLMLLAKSIPVASFVILALIWIGSSGLSVFISFLVVFPILYVNTIAGLESTDPKLREMALVFHVSLPRRIRFIYLPALMPYLISSCKIALGMSWKSGIAAEVIGVPSHTIGENLYMAKIYLATPDIFAWTIVIILVSALFEKFFLQLIIWMKKKNEQYQPENGLRRASSLENVDFGDENALSSGSKSSPSAPASVSGLCKSYGELPVFSQLELSFDPGGVYCLMAPSGAGKTTLLRILLGLETPDGGQVQMPSPVTAVFQENRLCEAFSPLDNVLLAAGKAIDRQTAYSELCRLLPEESILRPSSTLSGGMKRRAAIARALLSPSQAVIMDEPFTGLDEDTKQTVIDYVKEKTAGKLLLITTHQEEEAAALNGRIVKL